MSKFVIECPSCGRSVEARTGLFAAKKIDCTCGHTIQIKAEKLTTRECPHCGNTFAYDQSNGTKARCPVRREHIVTTDDSTKLAEFTCEKCGVHLQTCRDGATYICPMCDHVNDVAARLEFERIKSRGISSVIKFEGDDTALIWKHPVEDFRMGTQLIVHESQEAIFCRNGQALDMFGPGRYTLETQKLPLMDKAYSLPIDGEPFHSEVYFINKAVQTSIKWGTSDKVRFIDPLTSTPLEIGASGVLNLQVADGRKLLIKLVGTTGGIAWNDYDGFSNSIQTTFRPVISNAVKTNLPVIIKQQIDLLEIDEHIGEISDLLREKVIIAFEEYGLTIPEFYVISVLLPEDDPNFKHIRELHTVMLQTRVIQAETAVKTVKAQSDATVIAAQRQVELERQTTETEIAKREAERKIIEEQANAEASRLVGLTEAEVMRAKGYNHKDEIDADVRKAYAEGLGQMGNNAGGSSLGDVASLAVTLGAMSGVIGLTKEAVSPMFGAESITRGEVEKICCPNCSAEIPNGSKYCPDCGRKIIIIADDEAVCPACGQKTHKGRFCMECGAPLARKCPKCSAELPDNAKFCLECGEKI